MNGNKEKYRLLCEQRQSEVPLFLQYWWMEAVCRGKQWDVAMAYDGEQLLGVMPYLYGRKVGMTYILQPQLTQYTGPLYFYPEGLSASKRLDFEKETAKLLLQQIESLKLAFFLQHFSPQVTNWLPFYWDGYKQTTRYTYRIEDISDPEKVFEGFDAEKRQRKIRRYEQSTRVRFDMSPNDFAEIHNKYWSAKGKKDVLNVRFISDVCSVAVKRGNGVIASLYDEDDRMLAARFVAYDTNCAYSLMSAQDLQLHKNGHSETLFWALIKYLSDKTKAFDFEGSMDEGLEYVYRSFGTTQTPYFEISKCNNPLFNLLLKLKK